MAQPEYVTLFTVDFLRGYLSDHVENIGSVFFEFLLSGTDEVSQYTGSAVLKYSLDVIASQFHLTVYTKI